MKQSYLRADGISTSGTRNAITLKVGTLFFQLIEKSIQRVEFGVVERFSAAAGIKHI